MSAASRQANTNALTNLSLRRGQGAIASPVIARSRRRRSNPVFEIASPSARNDTNCVCIKAITLLELVISIALLSVIIIGLASVNLFSHFHMITADRAAVLQNEVSFILAHMQVRVAQATGMINDRGVVAWNPLGGRGFRVRIDRNDPPDPANYNNHTWVGYQQTAGATAIRYCDQIILPPLVCAGGWEILTTRILTPALGGFNYVILAGNDTSVGVNVTLTGRWDAAAGNAVDLRNPTVIERTELRTHSASSN